MVAASAIPEPTIGDLLQKWDGYVLTLATRYAKWLGGGVDVRDVAQAIRLTAVRKWPRYHPESGSFSTWLTVSVVRSAIRPWRQERYHTVPAMSLTRMGSRSGGRQPDPADDMLEDVRAPDPAAEADRAILQQRVRAALANLHPSDRELVERKFWRDEPMNHSGRERLRQVLERLGDVLDPLGV